jgi:thiol:disulfide interchange protein DsbD
MGIFEGVSLRRHFWLAAVLAAWLPCSAFAAAKTQLHLLLSAASARPGDTVWAGLEMDIPAPWHLYWRNGGDAGEPPKINWNLPPGVSAGEINWPIPAKLSEVIGDTPLVTYIYINKVVLLVPMTLAGNLQPGPVELTASVRWMECSELCVFGSNSVSATLAVADESKASSDAALLGQWRRKVPSSATQADASASWESLSVESNSRPVIIEWKTNAAPADFYPYANTNFDVSGVTETLKSSDGASRLRKIVKTNEIRWPDHLAGILVGKVDSVDPVAVEVDLPIQAPATMASPAARPSAAASGSMATMLLLAFLGGLILNFMPCVLPVIALKILGFVKQSVEAPGRVRNLGIVYGLGVIASFLILAGLAIGAQRAGGLANWGDAFRHPGFQLALTILMTLIALNLFGVFEITLGSKAAGAASGLAARQGAPGAFFNGVLATVLATPCTAPFLGAALAFAFTQSAFVTLIVFAAAGVGFAFPFVLLCMEPRWLGLLPRPGAWMEKFKIAMGFPMLATAVWLMWIATNASQEVLWLGLFLVVLALAAWTWGEFVQRGARRKALAAVICAILVAADFGLLMQGKPSAEAIAWNVWSPQAVEEAQRAGHPVLVDFTAKSCLTCQVNKLSSLEIDRTRAKLKEIGAVALVADYTRGDPAIASALREFNSGGIPLVLVYSKDPSKPPQILPTLLSPSIVLEALDRATQ